jgi:hypothetical protein
LPGCGTSLLPNEVVLPGGGEASIQYTEVEGLGAHLAWGPTGIWASSDKAGQVFQGSELVADLGFPGRGHFPMEVHGELIIGVAGEGVFDTSGGVVQRLEGALHFVSTQDRWVAATPEGVVDSQGRYWPIANVRKVAADVNRIAALVCDAQDCGVFLLGDSVEKVGTGEPAGDLGFWKGVLWWGEPEMEQDGGSGAVFSEDGQIVEGILGDHLGRRIGGGFAAGSVNWKTQPRRLRILSLEGEKIFALDRVAGSTSVALVGGNGDRDGDLGIGVPGWVGNGGAVVVVEDAQLP